jgi:beta-lactamase regulating signal transducer with metallopeptidase domain
MPTSAAEAFGGLTGRLVWLGLLHSLWIGLVVASGMALILRLGSRLSHRARYAILAVAMVVVASGPGAVVVAQYVASCRAVGGPSGENTGVVVIAGDPAVEESRPGAGPVKEHRASGALPARGVAQLVRSLVRVVAVVVRLRPVAIAVWLASTAGLGATLLIGAFGLRRLCRTAEPASNRLQDRARRLARLLRLRRVPEVLVHSRLAEPFLCGVFRPKILLPRRWAGSAPVASMDAILAHELAHARRRDQVVNILQRLVEVVLFFHPAVHWLSSALRRERELCADALAVRLTGDRLALAEALQSVACLRLRSARMSAVCASLGGPSASLLPRIQELIGMTPPHPRFPAWPFVAIPAAGLLALIATAAGAADDRPSAKPEQPRVASEDLPFHARPKVTVQDDRQISYQVRYVVGHAEAWRQLLLPRMKLIQQEADCSAWLLDDNALTDFLTSAQADTRTNVLMAPKVTSFVGAKATITSRTKHHYVSGVEDFEAGGPAFRPVVKAIEPGFAVEMTGTILPGATRLSVGVEDTALLGFHTMAREKQVGDQIIRAQYQIPTTTKRGVKVDCEIPKGEHLLISLGLRDQPGSLPGAARLANSVFARVGLPEFQPAPYTTETLVLITPRPIVLEKEERPVRPAAPEKDGPHGHAGPQRLP